MIKIMLLCSLVIFSKCLYATDNPSENLSEGLHQLYLGQLFQQSADEKQASIHYQMAVGYLEQSQDPTKSKTESSEEQSYSASKKLESLYETPKKQILSKRDLTKHLVGSSLDELTAKTAKLALLNEEDWSDSDSSHSSLDSDEEYVSDEEAQGKKYTEASFGEAPSSNLDKKFIAHYRGITYLLPHISTLHLTNQETNKEEKINFRQGFSHKQRRGFRKQSQVNKTHFSPLAYAKKKISPAQKYQPDSELKISSQEIIADLEELSKDQPTRRGWKTSAGTHEVFSSPAMRLQQRFTNTYDAYHEGSGWNPFVATSDEAKHAVKYAFGLKTPQDEKRYVLFPDYRCNGKPKRPYLGKVYVILHEEKEFKSSKFHHVPTLHAQGEISVGTRILPEKECSFWGDIEGEYIVYEENVRVPSLARYRSFYERKYGLTKQIYNYRWLGIHGKKKNKEGIQELIEKGDHEAQKKAEQELMEIIYVHQEQRLLRVAKDIARQKGGTIYYYHSDGTLKSKPQKLEEIESQHKSNFQILKRENLQRSTEAVNPPLQSPFKLRVNLNFTDLDYVYTQEEVNNLIRLQIEGIVTPPLEVQFFVKNKTTAFSSVKTWITESLNEHTLKECIESNWEVLKKASTIIFPLYLDKTWAAILVELKDDIANSWFLKSTSSNYQKLLNVQQNLGGYLTSFKYNSQEKIKLDHKLDASSGPLIVETILYYANLLPEKWPSGKIYKSNEEVASLRQKHFELLTKVKSQQETIHFEEIEDSPSLKKTQKPFLATQNSLFSEEKIN